MQYIAIFEVAICNITNWHIVSALVHMYVLTSDIHICAVAKGMRERAVRRVTSAFSLF